MDGIERMLYGVICICFAEHVIAKLIMCKNCNQNTNHCSSSGNSGNNFIIEIALAGILAFSGIFQMLIGFFSIVR